MPWYLQVQLKLKLANDLIFQVEKMLLGKHGKRLGFLKQRTHPNLPEEEVGLRKDIAREWNHIYETVDFTFWSFQWLTFQVKVLGIPEIADVVGGQISARGPST